MKLNVKKLNKAFTSLFVLIMTFVVVSTNCFAQVVDEYQICNINQKSYVLMDADTGEILLSRNDDGMALPAQTTKIMTIALFLELYDHDLLYAGRDKVTISYEMDDIPADSQQAYLQVGEQIQVYNLLMATEIISANDAANALAVVACGSVQAFVDKMNEKAVEIGCKNTHFDNPHGYNSATHYTTAYDMAKITAWALTVPGFEYFFQTINYVIPATNKQAPRELKEQNLMLKGAELEYEGLIGGKPGWTREQKYTLVEVAKRNGKTYIAVCMKCDGFRQKFYDARILLDYAFNVKSEDTRNYLVSNGNIDYNYIEN